MVLVFASTDGMNWGCIVRTGVILIALVGFAPSVAIGQECPPRSTLPPRLSGNAEGIEWAADADQIGDPAEDIFKMTRVAVNRDTEVRRVYWPRARMSIAALAPGAWVRHCPPAGVGRNVVDAPIYVRNNATPLPAQVYETVQDGQSSSLPIEKTSGERISLDTGYQRGLTTDPNPHEGVLVRSALTYENGRYVIRYFVRNTGRVPLYLSLDKLPSEVREKLQSGLSPLGVDKEVQAQVVSDRLPAATWLPSDIGTSAESMPDSVEFRWILPMGPTLR